MQNIMQNWQNNYFFLISRFCFLINIKNHKNGFRGQVFQVIKLAWVMNQNCFLFENNKKLVFIQITLYMIGVHRVQNNLIQASFDNFRWPFSHLRYLIREEFEWSFCFRVICAASLLFSSFKNGDASCRGRGKNERDNLCFAFAIRRTRSERKQTWKKTAVKDVALVPIEQFDYSRECLSVM